MDLRPKLIHKSINIITILYHSNVNLCTLDADILIGTEVMSVSSVAYLSSSIPQFMPLQKLYVPEQPVLLRALVDVRKQVTSENKYAICNNVFFNIPNSC